MRKSHSNRTLSFSSIYKRISRKDSNNKFVGGRGVIRVLNSLGGLFKILLTWVVRRKQIERNGPSDELAPLGSFPKDTVYTSMIMVEGGIYSH